MAAATRKLGAIHAFQAIKVAIAFFVDARSRVERETFILVIENIVDRARDRIGAIDWRTFSRHDVNRLDQRGGDDVGVNLRAGGCRAEQRRRVRRNHAAPVDQGQRPVRTEAEIVDEVDALAKRGLPAVRRHRTADLRQGVERVGDVDEVTLINEFAVDRGRRREAREVGVADTRARHRDRPCFRGFLGIGRCYINPFFFLRGLRHGRHGNDQSGHASSHEKSVPAQARPKVCHDITPI